MNENKVCHKLGVSNIDELNNVLKLNQIDEKIVELSENRYFNLEPLDSAKLSKISKLVKSKKVRPHTANGKWSVVLQNNPNDIIQLRFNIDFNGENIVNSKDLYLDKGHLLASEFQKYVLITGLGVGPNGRDDYDNQWNNFFEKGNSENNYTQFSEANRNSDEVHGQAYFEIAKIDNYLKNNRNAKVYYEIQAVFCNAEDKIPIGNRILAVNLGEDLHANNWFHVFIPNCDSRIDVVEGHNWSEFFKSGRLDLLKKKL